MKTCGRCGDLLARDSYVDIDVYLTEVGHADEPLSVIWCSRCASQLRQLLTTATAGDPHTGGHQAGSAVLARAAQNRAVSPGTK